MFHAPRSPYMNLAFEQPFQQTGTSTSCGTITVTEESSGGGGTPPDNGGGGGTPPDNGGGGGGPGTPGVSPGPGEDSDQIIPVIDDTLAFVGGGAVLLVIILLLLVTQT